jgi:hypothetical protein
MVQDYRISALKAWAKEISSIDLEPYLSSIEEANPWFTAENIDWAIRGVLRYLKEDHLDEWKLRYTNYSSTQKIIGVIMAGNLPLVGIHDFICVFASGHQIRMKLSHQDQLLLPLLLDKLDPEYQQKGIIQIVQELHPNDIDAIIATGSDNTTRYIKYHFGSIPSIIRGNRSSIAILNGRETQEQLSSLGNDVFTYFGRGCRSVSKLMVPVDYDLHEFSSCNRRFQELNKHQKYFNNYRYQKSLLGTENKDFIDAGYTLLVRNESVVSPLGVIHYQEYKDLEQLDVLISLQQDKIQCIASAEQWYQNSLDFGTLQEPNLWDYSDNLDTMKFLCSL